MPELIVAGLNHRTAPLPMRERVHVAAADLEDAISELRALPGVEGASVLSTCNRVEAIVSGAAEEVSSAVVEWFAERAGVRRQELENHLYVLRQDAAVEHLFRVASGLDSMIIGEPQIGGQVRCAFHTARKLASFDPLLQQVFEQTLRVAKRVRTQTGIGLHAVSIPYAAVELARKIFGDLTGLRVLLLGAGNMGEVTAQHLHKQRVRQIFVGNRSYDQAVNLAERFGGVPVHFDSLDQQLGQCDIIIASTAAPHFVISSEQVRRALHGRPMRSLFLIDLGVPRNIDPAVAAIEHAYLYNIDDLRVVADANALARQSEASEAQQIIATEVAAFRKRLKVQEAVPTILELQQRVEEIRASEMEKCLRKMGPITVAQRQAIEMLTLQMTNKLLHHPIVHLRDSSAEPHERESVRRTIRKVFGLG